MKLGRLDPDAVPIAARTGVDLGVVVKVLAIELEYLWRTGIASGSDPGTTYYASMDLAGRPSNVVDEVRLANEIMEFTGIPPEVSCAVMHAEMATMSEPSNGSTPPACAPTLRPDPAEERRDLGYRMLSQMAEVLSTPSTVK